MKTITIMKIIMVIKDFYTGQYLSSFRLYLRVYLTTTKYKQKLKCQAKIAIWLMQL